MYLTQHNADPGLEPSICSVNHCFLLYRQHCVLHSGVGSWTEYKHVQSTNLRASPNDSDTMSVPGAMSIILSLCASMSVFWLSVQRSNDVVEVKTISLELLKHRLQLRNC